MGQIVLLLLIMLVVAMIIAIKYLPWWGSVLLFAGLILAARYGGGWLIKRLFMIPFKMKGAVLKGAEIQIHSVVPAQAPAKRESTPSDADAQDDNDDEDVSDEEDDKTPRRYYSLDVTITPAPSQGKFQFWEPTELLLVHPSAANDIDTDDNSCVISNVEVEEDGEFRSDGEKYPGPRRLRLLLGVKEGVRELRFRYYFEAFGNVTLP